MHLATPHRAILSAVIFNALVIVALIPLALRGVEYARRRRRAPAAPQPADLRRRRPDRAVHRHQAHRPDPRRGSAWRHESSIMYRELRSASLLFVALTVITGVVYPGWSPAIAQLYSQRQANGSLIETRRQLVGSALIGQPLRDPSTSGRVPRRRRRSPTTPPPRAARTRVRPIRRSPTPSRTRIEALREADPGNKRPRARRPGNGVGAAASIRTSASPRPSTVAARGARARAARGRRFASWCARTPRIATRLPRRAARQRPAAQPRTRQDKVNLAWWELLLLGLAVFAAQWYAARWHARHQADKHRRRERPRHPLR